MLLAETRTSTSPGPATGSGYSSNFSTSGPPYSWTTIAFMIHLQERQTSIHEQLAEENWNWSRCGLSTACSRPTRHKIDSSLGAFSKRGHILSRKASYISCY